MTRTFAIIVAILAFHSLALCDEPTATPKTPQAKPKTAPMVVSQGPDILKNAVAPYNPMVERGRFFAAAGVDNELSAEEFAANQSKPRAFVRKFDTWEAMATFDKNANKTIDWFEADAYRRALAKKVLAAFDANKNRRLDGAERTAAVKALLNGKITFAKPASGSRPSATSQPGMYADWRKRWQLRMFDKNKDGQLDEQETAEMEKKTAEWKKRRKERRKAILEKYDADGDGKLSGEERKSMYADWRKRWRLRMFDKNKDGQLDEQETAEMEKKTAEWKKRREQRMKQYVKRFDANGDGKVSRDEVRNYFQKLRKRYDVNGDGKLSGAERRKMMDDLRSRTRERSPDGENARGR